MTHQILELVGSNEQSTIERGVSNAVRPEKRYGCIPGVTRPEKDLSQEPYKERAPTNDAEIPRPEGRGFFTIAYKERQPTDPEIPRPEGRGSFTIAYTNCSNVFPQYPGRKAGDL
jgi:hypothetical protein